MTQTLLLVAATLASLALPSQVIAKKLAPPPLSYAKQILEGKYVLVKLTAPDRDPEGCEECARLRATYPATGVYRNGSSIPLWSVGWDDVTERVVTVAEREGEIYLAIEKSSPAFADRALTFFRGQRKIREYKVSELVDPLLERSINQRLVGWYKRLDIDEPSQTIHVETAEGSKFVLDLFTGEPVIELRRKQPQPRRATAEEKYLGRRAAEVADIFVRLSMEGRALEAIGGYSRPLIVTDCEVRSYFDLLEEDRAELEEAKKELADSQEDNPHDAELDDWTVVSRPLGTPIPKLTQIQLGQASHFDLHLVPREAVIDFLCPGGADDDTVSSIIPDGPIYATAAYLIAGTPSFIGAVEAYLEACRQQRPQCDEGGPDREDGGIMLWYSVWAWDKDWRVLGLRYDSDH